MIIKCKVGGSLTLSTLGNIVIRGGEILNLYSLFSEEEIKRERRPPKGCLHLFMKRNLIEEVSKGSSDYLRYQQELKQAQFEQQKLEMKKNTRQLLKNFFIKKKMDKIKQINEMDYVCFDLLLDIKQQEKDTDVIYAIYKRLNLFSQQRLINEFILL